ncbi:MAG: chemotaxis protein CheW [Longimicrobiales bacterium]
MTGDVEHETSEAQERAILARRAAQLARRSEQTEVAETVEVAVFRYGRERYAIELGCLLQIFALRDLALLPGAKPPVIGLTPWRGGLLRLLDLGAALGRPHEGIADRKRVLALASGSQAAFGILIDMIDDVRTLPVEEIRPLPERDDEHSTLLRGVTRDAVLVLDADELIRAYQ